MDTTAAPTHGENNHVHLLVDYPPKVAVARLVNNLRGLTRTAGDRSLQISCSTTTGPTKLWPGS